MLDAALGQGQWWWAIIMILGSFLAAAYIFKVIGRSFLQTNASEVTGAVPAPMEWSALALALSAILLSLFAHWLLGMMDIGIPFETAFSPGSPG